MPKVSIVIPVYNVEEYLKQCLNSVVSQTFTDWECIVIDDGSTDLSWKICDNFAKTDKRFTVIHQKNQGVSKARNVGIETTKGDFIAFIDPDDYINEDYLSSMIHEQERTDADIVQAFVKSFFDDNTYIFPSAYSRFMNSMLNIVLSIGCNKDIFPLNSKSQVIDNLPNLSSNCWGRMFKSVIWKRLYFPDGVPVAEDTFTVLEAICNSETICKADNALYYYRVRKSSLSHKKLSSEEYDITIKAWSKSCNRIIEANPDAKQYVSWLYTYGKLYLRKQKMNRI